MDKKKIMIIDDSATICKTADLFLKESDLRDSIEIILVEGDSLEGAAGFEALSRIIEEKPSLIFLDVLMPKINGLQTCQIIKRNADFKHTPVIFMSSKDSEFDKARGLIAGADDYLIKPFKKDKIIDMVKKHLKI